MKGGGTLTSSFHSSAEQIVTKGMPARSAAVPAAGIVWSTITPSIASSWNACGTLRSMASAPTGLVPEDDLPTRPEERERQPRQGRRAPMHVIEIQSVQGQCQLVGHGGGFLAGHERDSMPAADQFASHRADRNQMAGILGQTIAKCAMGDAPFRAQRPRSWPATGGASVFHS